MISSGTVSFYDSNGNLISQNGSSLKSVLKTGANYEDISEYVGEQLNGSARIVIDNKYCATYNFKHAGSSSNQVIYGDNIVCQTASKGAFAYRNNDALPHLKERGHLMKPDQSNKAMIYPVAKVSNLSSTVSLRVPYTAKKWFVYNGKYYLYFTEDNETSYENTYYAYDSTTMSDFPSTLEIKQPIADLEFSFSTTKYSVVIHTFSSSSTVTTIGTLTATSKSELDALSGLSNNLPSEHYDTAGQKRVMINNADVVIWTASVQVQEPTKVYTIEKKDESSKFYAGKLIGEWFGNLFRLKYTEYNSYYSATTTILENLIPSNISLGDSKTRFAVGDALSFTYTYNNETITFTSSMEALSLAANLELRYSGLRLNLGTLNNDSIINLDDVSLTSDSYLTYSDGATINVSDVDFIVNKPYFTCPQTASRTFKVSDVDVFTIVADLESTSFGAMTKDFAYDFPDQLMLDPNTSNDFWVGETKVIPSNVRLQKLSNGVVYETLPFSSFMNSYLLPNANSGYGSVMTLEEAKNVTSVTLEFHNNNNIPATYTIYPSYFDNLTLDLTNAIVNYYVNDASEFVFDSTSIVASCVKVENNNEIKTSSTIANIEDDVELDAILEYEYSTNFDFSTSNLVRVAVKPKVTFGTGQVLYGNTISVNVHKLAPVELVAVGNDSTPYWDYINDFGIGVNYFHKPTSLTFKVKLNNDDYLEDNGSDIELDVDDLIFSLDNSFTEQLTTNTNIEESPIIYFKHPDYPDIYGSYRVSTRLEEVLSVDLANTTDNKFTYVKGNSPAVYKNDMVINVALGKSEGGNVVSSRTVQLQNISFVNPDTIVMDGATDIKVIVQGSQYTLSTSKISFVNPTIDQIVVNENGFKKSYINGIDKIDAHPLSVKVTYTNAEYEQVVPYSELDIKSSNSDLENYTFDGTTVVRITMGDDSVVTVPMTLTFNEQFSSSSQTASLNVDVIEVLDIVGIGIDNIYNEYKVNDTFLNENDNTQVTIFYKDGNTTSKYTTSLRDTNAALNITPIKGTKFKNVGDRLIRVSSATSNAAFEYSIKVQPQYELDDTETLNLVVIYGTYKGKQRYYLVKEEFTETDTSVQGGRKFKDNYTFNNVAVYGYLENLFDKGKNAKVTLYHDYIPPTDNQNNIDVVFPCYVEGNADLINKCQFGILFGNNNANNRLFLSGNLDEANCDWHSKQVEAEQVRNDETILNGNFGYFSDRSYCYYGETDNKVVGYDIVSNDKLLVLKDKSDKETTIYFRTPTIVTRINGAGTEVKGTDGETLYQEEFALTKGNNSVAGVSPSAVKNFNGDSLFISNDNNICGLDLTGIVGDNQRYATTRSYFIDEDLRERDLSTSWMWSDNKYLYLMLPEKIYLTHFEAKSEKQYEWWQINVGDVQAFLEYNGVTYFANNKGNFFKIGDNYQDIKKEFVGLGAATVEMDGNYIAVSSSIIENFGEKTYKFEIINENPVYNAGFSSDNHLYANIASIVNDSSSEAVFQVNQGKNHLEMVCRKNGKFDSELKARMTKLIADQRIFYLNNPNGESAIAAARGSGWEVYGNPYYLKIYIDNTSTFDTYKVYNAVTNEQLDVSTLYRANMVYRLDQEYDIVNIDKTENRFQIAESGTILDVIYYGNQAIGNQFRAEIKEVENVEAFYITKPYDLGGLDYFKTIWQWTLTNDTDIPSELELTYASNKIPNEKSKTLRISVDKFGLDFDKFTFTKVDFDKNIVPRTYTEQRLLTNQKFICFGFKNYNNTNSVLSSMSILYSIPHTSYGSD